MPQTPTFSCPKIAEEMQKHFQAKAPSFKVELKYRDDVQKVLKTIDTAHKQAGNRSRLFGS